MVTSDRPQLDLSNPSMAAAVEHFDIFMGNADDEKKLGELHPFGKYWIWAKALAAADEPLRLFQRTEAGIADLTTSHYSLHMVPAGTWHQISGLFDCWLSSDADHLWLQVPRSDRRYYLLLAGGSVGVNRRHTIAWHCQECGAPLGQPSALRHAATPQSFVNALNSAVDEFNADEVRRRCAACGSSHPVARRFAGTARNDSGEDDAERIQRAFGETLPRAGDWDTPIAKLAEIPTDHPLVVQIGKRQIALVRDGEEVRAIAAVCPHYAGPLGQGEVRHGEIVCPWHRFRFDLVSGRSKTNPALCAPTYEVRVAGGDVTIVGARDAAQQEIALEASQA